MSKPRKLLVLGSDGGSVALALTRALGRAGHHVVVGATKQSPVAGASRYAQSTVTFSDPRESVAQFRREVRAFNQQQCELVFGVNDAALLPFMVEGADPLPGLVAPTPVVWQRAFNKRTAAQSAREVGFIVPAEVIVHSLADVEQVPEHWPLVVKPQSSKVIIDDALRNLRVRVVRTKLELTAALDALLPFGPVLVQNFISGDGVGMSGVCQDGELVQAFQHRRLHQPVGGGGSYYRISETLDPILHQKVRQLVGLLSWHGPLMVEFLHTADGAYSFVEVNGRWWGSLALSLKAGLNLPATQLELLQGQQRSKLGSYRSGVASRLLTRDAPFVWQQYLGRGPIGHYRVQLTTWGLVKHLLLLLMPNERVDEVAIDDLKPFGLIIWRWLGGMLKRWLGRLQLWLISIWHRLPTITHHEHQQLLARFAPGRPLLFVCRGNISRSPFAAALLASTIHRSAGLAIKAGDRATEQTCRVAQRYGANVREHQPLAVDESLLEKADTVLVFERQHQLELGQRWPRFRHKVFPLFALDTNPAGRRDIIDPHQAPSDIAERSLARIHQYVTVILERL